MKDKAKEGFRKRSLGEPTKEINPANAGSVCPVCKTCRIRRCRYEKCKAFRDWFRESWDKIQMKWIRDGGGSDFMKGDVN